MTLEKEIFEKIEKEAIEPTAKWRFTAQHAFVWLLTAVTILVGSIALAIILQLTILNDWELYQFVSYSKLSFAASTFPYIWLFLFVILIAFVQLELRSTKTGYKFAAWKVALVSLVPTVVLGVIIFATGLTEEAPHTIHKADILNYSLQKKADLFHQPERGMLVGMVPSLPTAPAPENFVVLTDRFHNEWPVEVDEETVVFPSINFLLPVRVIGEPHENYTKAYIISPFILKSKQHEWVKKSLNSHEKVKSFNIKMNLECKNKNCNKRAEYAVSR